MVVMNAAKAGFGLALGFGALQIIGIILFLIGLAMAAGQKDKEKKNMALFGTGIAFMVLGVAMGFGGGADQLLGMFSNS
jgi:hypothetical protein